ncbi:MAG: hypothetical protein HZB38_14605 [Planctomycetes bacterium]|nr:hypothetical protein [Planctomycetota bacterium]
MEPGDDGSPWLSRGANAMQQAYIELSYLRREDDAPVTLVAPLPTVRPLEIGGPATDLRLPGIDPKSVFATISHTYDHFRIESRDGGMRVLVNNEPVRDEGVELHDEDVIRIGDYELTYHEGEPAEEPPLIDTQVRWKLRRPELDEEDSVVAGDENSRPYVDEFHLTIRPLLQSERYAEVQRRAESEIKRILRLDEAESLERYMQVLWWTRVRMSREAGDASAGEIAREAADLFPAFSPLMVACGTTFLAGRDWNAAKSAFSQALQDCRPEFVVSRHDARIGRILAEHGETTAGGPPSAAPRPPNQWWPRNLWDVPLIELHTPGDELLLWRMARYARLFGPADQVRYLYRGTEDPAERDAELIQRWEILDASRGVVYRRRVRVPALSLADPSLMLETHSICELFSKADREWGKHVVDLSHQRDDEPDAPPVEFDRTALDALPGVVARDGVVRISCRQAEEGVCLSTAPRPTGGDFVYQQGDLKIAIPPADAGRLAGSMLFYLRKPPGFHLKLSSGAWIAAQCDATVARPPTKTGTSTTARSTITALALVAVPILIVIIRAVMHAMKK